MQLTTHTDYAMRLLIYLYTHPDTPVSVAQVARAYGISLNHLAKVAQTLTRAGWVVSHRGRHGGMTLDPSAYTVSLGDVFRVTEHNVELVECFGDNNTCPIEPACGLKRVLREASDAFVDVLDQYSLEDMVRRPGKIVTLLTHTGK